MTESGSERRIPDAPEPTARARRNRSRLTRLNRCQFGLSALFWLTALVAVVSSLVRLFGWIALPVAGVASIVSGIAASSRGRAGPLLSGVYSIALGAITGSICASVVGGLRGTGPEGALIGAVVAEATWVFINVLLGSCAASAGQQSATEGRSCGFRVKVRYLILAAFVFLLGPLVSTILWVVAMFAMQETIVVRLDWAFYLVRFTCVGVVAGVLLSVPFLFVGLGLIADGEEQE